MNQIHQNTSFDPKGEEPAKRPTPNPQPKLQLNPAMRLTIGDARALHSALTKGDDALAQRRDLGELYKRLVTMITTLDSGLKQRQTARSDDDRALLTARLDGVEKAINEVEGVLRIELEPLLRSAINEAVEGRMSDVATPKRTSLGVRFLQILVLLGAVYLGSVYPSEVKEVTYRATEFFSEIAGAAAGILSPSGGIETAPNHIE